MGEEKPYFLLLKSVKRKSTLRQRVSTHFVTDCRLGFAKFLLQVLRKKLISVLLHGHVIRPFRKSNFKCAEFDEDEENLRSY